MKFCGAWSLGQGAGEAIDSLTMHMLASSGSDCTLKPSSRHIASIVVLSRSTWPSISRSPSLRAYSMMVCIKQPAEPAPLQVGADQDRVLAAVVGGVGMQAHDAEQLSARRLERDECHRARIVDLGEARDEGVAQVLDRREEAQPQVLIGHAGEEVRVQPSRPPGGSAGAGSRVPSRSVTCLSHSFG